MSNTINAGLILDTLAKVTQTTVPNAIAPWTKFTTDFTDDQYVVNQGKGLQVPFATAGASVQTNATSWETGDTTLSNVSIALSGKSISFHITPLQMNNSVRLAQLMTVNVQNFRDALLDVITTPMTGVSWTNFIQAASGFSATNLQNIWGVISKSPQKNIVLDGSYFSKFLPSSLTTEIGPRAGLAGYDGFDLCTRWTGAGTNVLGFAGGPQCIAIASALPMYDDDTKADINATVLNLDVAPGKTLPVLMSTWLARSSRTRWASLDVLIGSAVLDNGGGGVVIKSGGTA